MQSLMTLHTSLVLKIKFCFTWSYTLNVCCVLYVTQQEFAFSLCVNEYFMFVGGVLNEWEHNLYFDNGPGVCRFLRQSYAPFLQWYLNIQYIVIKGTRLIIYYARQTHKSHQWHSDQKSNKAKQVQSWRALRTQNSSTLCQI